MTLINPRVTRVVGNPGTGKTTTLVERVKEELNDTKNHPFVSVVAFTRAAATEVNDRLRGTKLGTRGRTAKTIHAACRRAIYHSKYDKRAPSPKVVGDRDSWDSFRDYCGNLSWYYGSHAIQKSYGDRYENPVSGDTLHAKSEYYRNTLTPVTQWDDTVLKWFVQYDRWKKATGYSDFTDWLVRCSTITPMPAVESLYIDEAQDLTPLQWKVIKKCPARNLIIVGDANQCLYEWSGASPQMFSQYDAYEEIVLPQSYRVPKSVHEVANRILMNMDSPNIKPYSPTDLEGDVDRIDWMPRDGYPKRYIDSTRTTMILTHTHHMLKDVTDDLMRLRIPFHNPYKSENYKWNPISEDNESSMGGFLSDKNTIGSNAQSYLRWLPPDSLKEDPKKISRRLGARKGTIGGSIGENIDRFLTDDVLRRVKSKDLSVLLYNTKRRGFDRWSYLVDMEARGVDWRNPKIIVGTIHSVKGGEADDVILSPSISTAAAVQTDWDPVYRMMYVGATRARSRLMIANSNSKYSVKF